MKSVFAILIFTILGLAPAKANTDSLGVRKVGSNTYIVHKVNRGQGIYTIAKMYGVTIAELQQLNPEIKSGLAPYQLILVPIRKHSAVVTNTTVKKPPVTVENKSQPNDNQSSTNNSQSSTSKSPIYHTVTPGETVYRVAVNHKITVEQLKSWNNLTSNSIEVGQQLIVGYKTGTDDNISDIVIKDTRKDTQTRVSEKVVETGILPEGTKLNTQRTQTESKIDKKKTGKGDSKEIDETVAAAAIDDASLDEKLNLALHRTAPEGTIIKVTNPMNNKVVFVKVIGKLRDAPGEQKIAIKITRNAADRLGIMDKVFRLQLQYSIQ